MYCWRWIVPQDNDNVKICDKKVICPCKWWEIYGAMMDCIKIYKPTSVAGFFWWYFKGVKYAYWIVHKFWIYSTVN